MLNIIMSMFYEPYTKCVEIVQGVIQNFWKLEPLNSPGLDQRARRDRGNIGERERKISYHIHKM